MSYDDKIKRAEEIIAQLEAAEALSMDEYKRLAAEATELLKQCKSLLAEMHEDMTVRVENLGFGYKAKVSPIGIYYRQIPCTGIFECLHYFLHR